MLYKILNPSDYFKAVMEASGNNLTWLAAKNDFQINSSKQEYIGPS